MMIVIFMMITRMMEILILNENKRLIISLQVEIEDLCKSEKEVEN